MNGGKPSAFGHQVGHRVQKFLGTVRLHPDGQAGLVGLDLFCGLERQVGHRIGPVLSVPPLAAHGEVLELVIPGKIIRRIGGDGPHPLRVFQPQGIHQLLGKGLVQGPLGQVRLIVWGHVLIKPPGIQRQGIF